MKYNIANSRFFIILTLLSSLSFCGCNKETERTNRETTRFTVSIEKGPVDESKVFTDELAEECTKTVLDANDYVCWSDGDKVFINGDGVSSVMDVKPMGSDATTAVLSGILPTENDYGRKYYGYYPASTDYWDISGGNKVKLPAVQTYDAARPLANVPMYAESDDPHLTFRNLFGLMEFRVIGGRTVKSIKLTSTGDEYIAGTFKLDANGQAVYSGDGSKTVELKVNPGIKIGSKGGVCFYIAVPAQTYTGLELQLTTEESATVGGEDYHKTIGAYTVRKGLLYASTFDSEPMSVQLWTGGPYWATVFIGATTNTQKSAIYCWGACETIYKDPLPNSGRTNGEGKACTFKTDNPESTTKLPNWSGSLGFVGRNAPYGSGDNYKGTFTKYTTEGEILENADNVAIQKWGSAWDMPDKTDAENLINKCTITRVTNYNGSGREGYEIVNKSDASKKVFYPANGWGEFTKYYYVNRDCMLWTKVGSIWTSSLGGGAYTFGGVDGDWSVGQIKAVQRCDARPVVALRRSL